MNTDYMTPNELAHELWSHMPEHEYEANETGLKSIVGKVFGSGTGVVHNDTGMQQIEHKS